jgi:hypothetical protein
MAYKILNFKSARQLNNTFSDREQLIIAGDLYSCLQEDKRLSKDVSELYFPKALNIGLSGRSSDLSRSYEAFPSHFFQ